MPRTLLLFVLGLAIVLETVLTAGAFFAPTLTMSKFGVKYGADTAFLAYITGWFLLLVTLMALMALWWIGIGIGIYVTFGRPDNLLLDSLKGLLIIGLTWRCQAGGLVLRR
jgi:hypothetical protein